MEKHAKLFDVCIVCALYEEAKAVINEFSTRCNVTFTQEFTGLDRYEYQYASILNKRGEHLTVLVTWLSESGPTQTGLDLKPFLHEFHPRFVAMTGFCAGYKRKVKWGDLIVAQYAYFYEAGKIEVDREGLLRHLQEMKAAAPTSQVHQYTKGCGGWKEPVKKMKCDRLKRELKETEEPHCVIAPMASGMAVRQDDPFPWLREHYDRNTVGLDMEAATFYQALRAFPHIPGLVVKGVCDYANMRKNDTYHDYAARASAIYLLSFIQEYVTEETMPRRDTLPSPSIDGPSIFWKVPRRNPLFTGREVFLQHLHETLNAVNSVILTYAPQAISGMGGIGKTQAAIEYAYRYSDDYETVLWVKADKRVNIRSDFRDIAKELHLPEKEEKTPSRVVVKAVKDWLEKNTKWLLIFDNADELKMVQNFLPRTLDKGQHMLLTTRDRAVRQIKATPVEIDTMNEEEGSLFLLRRAGRLAPTVSLNDASDADQSDSRNIVRELGGLPLALEQAGAYIDNEGISLSEYLERYQKYRADLLKRFQDKPPDYNYTVATTWNLSFQRVNETNPAAIELLYLCAFLDPDAIPEEIITGGTPALGPVLGPFSSEELRMDEIRGELLHFSLVRRNFQTKTLTIHRLVQAVIRHDMGEEMRKMWAERTIRMVHHAFPVKVNDVKTWPQCQRCLPHAQACAEFIKDYRLVSLEAAQLLNQVGYYLREQARYREAEEYFRQALAISKQLGPEHLLYTAQILNNLARLYFDQYKHTEATPFYEQALAIREQELGSEDPVVVQTLNSLALNYWYEGNKGEKSKYLEAEALYERGLPISKQKLGPEHDQTLFILNNQALLYRSQGKYDEAIELNQHVLAIREKKFGSMHKEVAQSLQNLGVTYYEQGGQSKYEEAERLLKRALEIREKLLSKKDLQIARCLNYLALVYQAQGKYKEAAQPFKRALDIIEEQLGREIPETISIAKNYHSLLQRLIPELNEDIIALEKDFSNLWSANLDENS